MDFVFDLDGTICFDGENIPQEIIKALKKASDYGHEVSFASARSYRDCVPVLKDEFKKNTVLALNGACVFRDEKLIDYNVIDSEVYKSIVDICLREDLPYFIDDYMNYTYNKKEKISFFQFVDTYKVAKSISLTELKEPVKMVIFTEDNHKVREEIITLVNGSNKLSLMYHENEKAIYINPCNTNKAISIINDISPKYIAFGNDKNDIEMFQNALHSVQIGDYKELKQVSSEIIQGENLTEKIAEKIVELFEKYQW